MERMIDALYIAIEQEGGFEKMDRAVTEECDRQLTEYRNRMGQQEYENLRDVLFSVYAIAKKSSFEEGFKAAMRLVLEFTGQNPLT